MSLLWQIITEVGSGEFADFSNVQFVNISGSVTSIDPSSGMITYRPQIIYKFSCLYPMQYLLNNTQLAVWVYAMKMPGRRVTLSDMQMNDEFIWIQHRSGVSLAVRDNNGSFISTLSMELYKVRPALTVLFRTCRRNLTVLLLSRTSSTERCLISPKQDSSWRPRFMLQLKLLIWQTGTKVLTVPSCCITKKTSLKVPCLSLKVQRAAGQMLCNNKP